MSKAKEIIEKYLSDLGLGQDFGFSVDMSGNANPDTISLISKKKESAGKLVGCWGVADLESGKIPLSDFQMIIDAWKYKNEPHS